MRGSRKLFRCLASLTVVVVGLLSWLFPLGRFWSGLPPSARAAGVVFTVNSGEDTDDGVCNAANCTLREAINAANAIPGLDNINFNISGTFVKTIKVGNTGLGSLPTITDPVFINGTTQPGFASTPIVELRGASAGTSADGLKITAGGTTIQGLVIDRFNGDGIELATNGNNEIIGNFIGTNADGDSAFGNANGIFISGSPNNTIGGSAASTRNIISGNASGILIFGSASTGNIVQGNYIGTDVNGTADLGNSGSGVLVYSSNNVIGSGNVISGNNASGVEINGTATGNQVRGNFIGTNAAGTAKLANSGDGVRLGDTATGNTIGAISRAFVSNVISGNAGHGIQMFSNASGNQVVGNFIGTNAAGNAALGNGNSFSGVVINSANNKIGGTVAGAGNVISGNSPGRGILISGNSANGNQVLGNLIGTDVNGTAALGNSIGIQIISARNNIIGGTAGGSRNVISANVVGVEIVDATGNQVLGNFVGTNAFGTAQLGNAGDGVKVDSSNNNIIGGTLTGARNVISGNGAGVEIRGDFGLPGTNNQVLGNFIGTAFNGTAPLGNSGPGVFIDNFANNNTVGGTTTAARNVISGNGSNGVWIRGGTATANQVQGNFIGTDVNGAADLGNTNDGVLINDSPSNTVGGTTVGARNIISGNNNNGVEINGSNAFANQVLGNYIGTDQSGTFSIPNGHSAGAIPPGESDGVVIAGASDNIVGGAAAGAQNVISGNHVFGVCILGSGSTGNQVQGNIIGMNATGISPLGNLVGVTVLSGASNNTIGGPASGDKNVVSGNRDTGIDIVFASANRVQGNAIGTRLDGISPAANLGNGVVISDGSNNSIGGVSSGESNTIAFNGGDGIAIFSTGTTNGNDLRSNRIFSNGGLGIDLGSDGVTANDPGDGDTGSNNLQNFPVLNSAVNSGNNTVISGTLNSTANTTFAIDFFQVNSCDPSGFGEGQTIIGGANAVTNGSGNASISLSIFPIFPGAFITATATDPAGNTSEFSQCIQVTGTISSNVQFSSSNYSVQEDCTTVTITVNRVGDTSGAASVNYATSDVTASERRDYITALGKLQFASGETSKSFVVLINEDSYVEGAETFNISLSNPSGLSLGAPAIATVTITDDASEPATNVIDDPQNFVCQHYHDFLNRQPDTGGLNFWKGQLDECETLTIPELTALGFTDRQNCREVRRINVSAAFYLSIEFRQTGYLVERIYKAAYGNANGTSTFGGTHQLPVPIVRLNEFLSDTQEIGQGVVVGQAGWETVLENNKQAFTSEFVQRSRFTTAFPAGLTPAQFVDVLNVNAGNPLSQSERDQLVNSLTSGTITRAQVMRAVAEDSDLNGAEFNRAFVLMQYFGYLRRNPNDPPDTDYTGYDFWLTKLNQFNGNFVNADMVKAFIISGEYRNRFRP